VALQSLPLTMFPYLGKQNPNLRSFYNFCLLGFYGTKSFEQCKVERQIGLRTAFGFELDDNVTFPHEGGVNYYTKDGIDYALTIPSGPDVSRISDCTLRGSIEAVSVHLKHPS